MYNHGANVGSLDELKNKNVILFLKTAQTTYLVEIVGLLILQLKMEFDENYTSEYLQNQLLKNEQVLNTDFMAGTGGPLERMNPDNSKKWSLSYLIQILETVALLEKTKETTLDDGIIELKSRLLYQLNNEFASHFIGDSERYQAILKLIKRVI